MVWRKVDPILTCRCAVPTQSTSLDARALGYHGPDYTLRPGTKLHTIVATDYGNTKLLARAVPRWEVGVCTPRRRPSRERVPSTTNVSVDAIRGTQRSVDRKETISRQDPEWG